ncbi:hypothetical protein ANN_23633 [Periplaneta americana]|uniref:Uncharacterized protein n=1 Tax=Periplaneta americana TaxID=6978 RepID=A0ABQ8SLM1_PERAM|nr:hypothetical protein ANN_23633 [Periplaneta americana]
MEFVTALDRGFAIDYLKFTLQLGKNIENNPTRCQPKREWNPRPSVTRINKQTRYRLSYSDVKYRLLEEGERAQDVTPLKQEQQREDNLFLRGTLWLLNHRYYSASITELVGARAQMFAILWTYTTERGSEKLPHYAGDVGEQISRNSLLESQYGDGHTAQRIFLVETFLLKDKSYGSTVHKFLRQFRDAAMPSRQYITKLFTKWRQIESVLIKKREPQKRVLTEEKLADIQAESV